jgi:hypothetical protein
LKTHAERFVQVDRVRWDGTLAAQFGLVPVESLDGTIQQVGNIAASRDRVFVGNGNTPEYRVYSGSGELLQIVRWKAQPKRVTPAMRQAAIRGGAIPGPDQRESFPFYKTIRPAPGNAVWVQDYSIPPAPVGYTVFDGNGSLIGRVELPGKMTRAGAVGWVGIDRVLLTWRDADGAPHLTLHRLVVQ